MINNHAIYTYIPLNDSQLLEFTEQINPLSSPILVPVIDTPGPAGNSYWNVDAAIKKVGGKMQLGWDVNLWRGCFIVATHHAILLSDSGEFFDVTQRPAVAAAPFVTTFIPDDSIQISLDKNPAIASKFFILNNSPEVCSYIKSYENLNTFEKKMSELMHAHGYRCETNKSMAKGVPEQAANIVSINEVNFMEIKDKIKELTWIMKEKIIKLKKYSDSLNRVTH
ncbi:hypothetical protein M3J48_14070 [Klebsiella quasipneumoniae]|uniref:hypothetical protein n=1 Tax=Klebsiella quasipneumoniae TaxID=1463165 RepID=UPI002AB996D5|nr:hypothetical protein [Klebsiella quasipneumoniae]MDZ2012569.1 hypothetical protein [Klebsiella quasipneumoniae]